MPVEPNDHNLPLGGKLYPPIKRSFDAQARLVVDRLKAGRKSTFFTPAELLGPNDPQLRDELPRIIPVISGIWDKSGKRLYGEIGFDPDRWRVTSEYLRSAIQDSAMQFAESTQATFREDLALTYEQIRQEIRDDIEASRLREGESLNELTKRVAKYFTDSNRWRARRIAQTEATRAHHLARERSAIETGGVVQGWEWVTTSQSCPICDAIARDVNNPTGRRQVRIGMPFAIRGSDATYATKRFPPAHPHCVLGETPIRAASIVSAIHAKYQGPIVRIECGDGSRFSVTANHMLLTPTGFARASDLVQGDDVTRTATVPEAFSTPSFDGPNDDNAPATAEQIFHSLCKSGRVSTSGVPVSAENLHGDGRFVNSDVDIVRPDSLLWRDRKPFLGQPIDHLSFIGGTDDALCFDRLGDLRSLLNRLRLATDGGMGRLRESKAIFWASLRHAEKHGLGSVSLFDADLMEFADNARATDAKRLSQTLNGLPGFVTTAKIVKVDVYTPQEPVSVYDFETSESMYIIDNGIVSSNCRCTTRAILDPIYSGTLTVPTWSQAIDFNNPQP